MGKFGQLLQEKRLIKYGIVGITGTVVDVAWLYLLVEFFSLNVIHAATISFMLAVVNNYYFNAKWTFEQKQKKYKAQKIKFYAVSVVGLFINIICMMFFVNLLAIYYIVAKLLTSCVVLTWNFLGNQYWTFFEEIPHHLEEITPEYELSIIIPAYNEEKRIVDTLRKIESFLSKKKLTYEIIVVDDGSRDKTVEVVRNSGVTNLRIIQKEINRGKGDSVRLGMLSAKGRYALFTDADNSTPIEEFDKMRDYFDDYKVIIGSRYLRNSNVEIRQPFYRRFVSRLGNLLIRAILIDNIHDTQCGFKAFELVAARNIFSRVTVERFGFDMEVLAISKMLKYEIKEVGVHWINDPKSKIHIIKDSMKTFIELIYVKLSIWVGRYE